MVVPIAEAIEISADELLGMKKARLVDPRPAAASSASRSFRLHSRPRSIRTIDTFLKLPEK